MLFSDRKIASDTKIKNLEKNYKYPKKKGNMLFAGLNNPLEKS